MNRPNAIPNQTTPIVCFDLGGVLVETCVSWEDACVRSGIGLRAPRIQERRRAERRAIARRYQLGVITTDEFVNQVSDALEQTYSPLEVAAIHRAVVLGQTANACETVELVQSLGFRMAVLSNNNELHWRIVNSFPAVAMIPERFSSHLLKSLKPDESIFAQFEERVGTPASEIFFFDDQADNVAAARRRGWNAMVVQPAETVFSLVREALTSFQRR